MTEETVYVGDLIRRHIKENKLTNGYAIKILADAGIKLSDTRFSNKIYGDREQFTAQEVSILSKGLKAHFNG